MTKKSLWPRMALAALLALALPLTAHLAFAQTGAAGSGKIRGQVLDPTGSPITTGGTVSLYFGGMESATSDPKYVLNLDPQGNFSSDNVGAGSYSLVYRAPDTPKGKVVDQIDNVKVETGQTTTQNIDMSRQAYIDKLTPEQKKALEEAKAKNASILKENAQIKNLNGDLAKARQDDKDKNFADAAALMQHDVNIKPDAAVLWVELGLAQRGLKQWSDAVTNLQKGIELDAAGKKPDPVLEGAANDALGESLAAEGKYPDAQAAYDAAAKVNPAGAGTYYANETIIMDRYNQPDAVVAAADKAIAADPTKPIPYYLKGKALINKATVDPKTQKIIAPDGCAEAYQKYLELAPTGQFAADAKQILAEMNTTQSTSYKAGKKH